MRPQREYNADAVGEKLSIDDVFMRVEFLKLLLIECDGETPSVSPRTVAQECSEIAGRAILTLLILGPVLYESIATTYCLCYAAPPRAAVKVDERLRYAPPLWQREMPACSNPRRSESFPHAFHR